MVIKVSFAIYHFSRMMKEHRNEQHLENFCLRVSSQLNLFTKKNCYINQGLVKLQNTFFFPLYHMYRVRELKMTDNKTSQNLLGCKLQVGTEYSKNSLKWDGII